MVNNSQQDVKATSFLTPNVLFTNINHFESSEFLHVTFFWETPNTLHRLSH